MECQRWDNHVFGIQGHGCMLVSTYCLRPAHRGVWAWRCQRRMIFCWALCSYMRLQRLMPPNCCGANTMLHGRLWWKPILFKMVAIDSQWICSRKAWGRPIARKEYVKAGRKYDWCTLSLWHVGALKCLGENYCFLPDVILHGFGSSIDGNVYAKIPVPSWTSRTWIRCWGCCGKGVICMSLGSMLDGHKILNVSGCHV